jgi:hypothetical protein
MTDPILTTPSSDVWEDARDFLEHHPDYRILINVRGTGDYSVVNATFNKISFTHSTGSSVEKHLRRVLDEAIKHAYPSADLDH